MPTHQPITLTLDRQLLEHPEAVHLRRMRMALWLYLALLGRLPKESDSIEIAPSELAQSMGLPEGTVRSWIGHLRKARYIALEHRNGTLRIALKHLAATPPPPMEPGPRLFTVAKLTRALGERVNASLLERALGEYPDDVIQRALAGALAVPDSEIRRSRTALFLYLLKRYGTQN
jgi:DNA-binding transcriptional ArsR family regulator